MKTISLAARFLVVVVLYLAGGVAVQAGVRKARGKERMPNIEFWSALPGFIKVWSS